MNCTKLALNLTRFIALIMIATLASVAVFGQMRKVFLDDADPSLNDIHKLSFYSASDGYIATRDWIGYTTDSGHTMIKKYIGTNNVDFNGYQVNLTFGFNINGVKAFNLNTIIVYGCYGYVSAILYSTDSGNSFKLIFHSQAAPLYFNDGIIDMIFPQNGNIGYAYDETRVLKTVDKGLTWSTLRYDPDFDYSDLQAVDDNTAFIYTGEYNNNKLLKTNNGGANWQPVLPPADAGLGVSYFLDANTGWMKWYSMYKTIDGGGSWTVLNDPNATPFSLYKMKFVDPNIGYALNGNEVYKTSNGGVLWERLPRDNNYSYLGFTFNDLQCLNSNQLWAGGGHLLLELSNNGGGTPLPNAYFKIDTAGVSMTNVVNLINYSKPGYQFEWYVNNALIGTGYNTSFTHVLSNSVDSVKLISSSNGISDTLTKYQYFHASDLPSISTFSPISGGTGTAITINGTAFTDVTSVKFGGVEAASFTIVNDSKITAMVAYGATGTVTVSNIHGISALPGFTFLSAYNPPTISYFTPGSGPVNTIVAISGTNFNTTPQENIVFFGATKAKVLSATTTQVICQVPVGANFRPISLLNKTSGLACESLKPFNVTFADSSKFSSAVYFPGYSKDYQYSGRNSVWFTAGKDIDGDGKTDLIISHKGYSDSILISRSTTDGNTFSFEPPIKLGAKQIKSCELEDMDGDGKPDMVVIPYVASNTDTSIYLFIYKNNSIPGSISFSNPITLHVPKGSRGMGITDINNDGKRDIMIATEAGVASIFVNASIPGVLSFSEVVYPLNVNGVIFCDLDGDGKRDLISPINIYYPTASIFSCYLNNASIGNISFAPKVDFSVVAGNGNDYLTDIKTVDYDNDGKVDIVAFTSLGFHIFRNISTAGNIAFAPAINTVPPFASNGFISNVSGDSKPDIIVGGGRYIYKNLSVPGTILTDTVRVNNPAYPNSLDFVWSTPGEADFNMDGKIDIAIGNGYKISISKNITGIPFISAADGDWDGYWTWPNGQMPPPGAIVIIKNHVTINQNVNLYSLTVQPPAGSVTVSPGVIVTLAH